MLRKKFDEMTATAKTTAEKLEILEKINSDSLATACATICTANGVQWDKLVDGVNYDTLVMDNDGNIDIVIKSVKVKDLFILKANSKSNKKVIAGDLYTMLECFGVNLSDSYFATLDNAVAKMHVYTKYVPTLDCFVCETATSNNQLEKQLDAFIAYFYKDAKFHAKKCYVVHLKQMFTKAVKTGYRNGNALTLLQLVIDHVVDCKNNTVYTVKSGLNSHKQPKDTAKAKK